VSFLKQQIKALLRFQMHLQPLLGRWDWLIANRRDKESPLDLSIAKAQDGQWRIFEVKYL
jgi:hypothetical protein